MQVLVEPGGVGSEHGDDEAVVCQLEPGLRVALLRADEVCRDEAVDRVVVEASRRRLLAQHLAADPAGGDEPVAEPLAERALGRDVRGGDLGHAAVVVRGQRGIDVAGRQQVLHTDRAGIGRELVPQPPAHHLQLQGLDVETGLRLEAAVGLLNGDRRQILRELFGGVGCELAAGVVCRPRDRIAGGVDREQIDAERVAQAGRHVVAERVERPQIVLAQREQRPYIRVLQRLPELPEELAPRLDSERVERQHLLELVEDQHDRRRRARAARTPGHVLRQRHGRELFGRPSPSLRQPLLQAGDGARHETVAAVRGRLAQPDRRPDVEPLPSQPRHEARVEQRALPRSGRASAAPRSARRSGGRRDS